MACLFFKYTTKSVRFFKTPCHENYFNNCSTKFNINVSKHFSEKLKVALIYSKLCSPPRIWIKNFFEFLASQKHVIRYQYIEFPWFQKYDHSKICIRRLPKWWPGMRVPFIHSENQNIIFNVKSSFMIGS